MGVQDRWNKSQVAELLRISRRLHSEAHSVAGRHRMLLEAACDLIGACNGLLVVGAIDKLNAVQRDPARTIYLHSAVRAGASEAPASEASHATSPAGLALHQIPESDPAARKLLRRIGRNGTGSTFTRMRRELIDDKTWYDDHHVRTLRRAAGLDHAIYSAHRFAPGQVALMCLLRPWQNRRRFAPRDRDTIELIHSHASWIFFPIAPPDLLIELPLSPREKQTLWKLLGGQGEKQIAADMKLSPNTVHHYVKAIYRHFEVSSRAELLAKWVKRVGELKQSGLRRGSCDPATEG